MTSRSAAVAVRSFAKINLGLYIGARRDDGFHDLRTVYQTIALHDVIRVSVARGGRSGAIEIICDDARVPCDSSNTCHRVAALVMEALGVAGKVTIEIEKKLPVQGGLGAASSNAVATMLAMEKALKTRRAARGSLTAERRLRIASQVGSDLPLFLVGGTVLGVGRGEEVYPLPDLPGIPIVMVTPEIGVSTPKAFAEWDALAERERNLETRQPRRARRNTEETQDSSTLRTHSQASASASVGMTELSDSTGARPNMAISDTSAAELTGSGASDRLLEVGRALSAWLCGNPDAGAPAASKSGGRAGSLLSDLVRAGIENDFERVVFSEFPELRDMKRALERAGSRYASLSGSGSTLYGLFESASLAEKAANRLRKQGLKAVGTRFLTRQEYWRKLGLAS